MKESVFKLCQSLSKQAGTSHCWPRKASIEKQLHIPLSPDPEVGGWAEYFVGIWISQILRFAWCKNGFFHHQSQAMTNSMERQHHSKNTTIFIWFCIPMKINSILFSNSWAWQWFRSSKLDFQLTAWWTPKTGQNVRRQIDGFLLDFLTQFQRIRPRGVSLLSRIPLWSTPSKRRSSSFKGMQFTANCRTTLWSRRISMSQSQPLLLIYLTIKSTTVYPPSHNLVKIFHCHWQDLFSASNYKKGFDLWY